MALNGTPCGERCLNQKSPTVVEWRPSPEEQSTPCCFVALANRLEAIEGLGACNAVMQPQLSAGEFRTEAIDVARQSLGHALCALQSLVHARRPWPSTSDPVRLRHYS